jgi:uncharacterized protein (TIGR00369 family)
MTDADTTPDARPGWGEERSRTVTWSDPAPALGIARAMSGLEYLEGMRDGVYPPPPTAQLLGMGMQSVERGEVVFTVDPHESQYNPLGVVHGGVVCTVLDTVVGCAVHTTLEAGWFYTSIDLAVSYLRPFTLASGPLTVTGRLVKPGRRVAFAEGVARDATGREIATATSSLLVMPPEGDSTGR